MHTEKICILILFALLAGCSIDSYQSAIKGDNVVFNYQTPPLLTTKDDIDLICSVEQVDVSTAGTYRDALKSIARDIRVPIVVMGKNDFLDRKIVNPPPSNRSVHVVLKALMDDAGRSYSIKKGWIKVR